MHGLDLQRGMSVQSSILLFVLCLGDLMILVQISSLVDIPNGQPWCQHCGYLNGRKKIIEDPTGWIRKAQTWKRLIDVTSRSEHCTLSCVASAPSGRDGLK